MSNMATPPHVSSTLVPGTHPATMHPLTSTPVGTSLAATPPPGSRTVTRLSSVSSTSLPTSDTLSNATIQLLPGQLEVPILGYEVIEERAKFTVFKIQIFQGECESWFIFRRYNDFCRLNNKLSELFPHFRLALPPKKWFGDNFEPLFLEDRVLGLQAFLNNVISNREVCNSEPVREFLCIGTPPGPHDTLEDSRALSEFLEGQLYSLKQELQTKDTQLALLQDECEIYRQEVVNLRQALRLECERYAEETCNVQRAVHHAISLVLLKLSERNLNRLSPAPSSEEPSENSLTEQEQVDTVDAGSTSSCHDVKIKKSVSSAGDVETARKVLENNKERNSVCKEYSNVPPDVVGPSGGGHEQRQSVEPLTA